MASLNKTILIGNLTRDPEVRYLASGQALCKLGLAVNEKRKKGDEWVEVTTFVDITVWGKQGESCSQYLAKGRQVAVEGRLTFSQWETDEGQKRSKLEVTAENVVFLGKGGNDKSEPTETNDDEVPF